MDFSDHIMLDFTCACVVLLISTFLFTAKVSLLLIISGYHLYLGSS